MGGVYGVRSAMSGEGRGGEERVDLVSEEWLGEKRQLSKLLSYRFTSLFGFCRFRWSLMNQWSQATSPSMLPFAPAVNPLGAAPTANPPLAGATVTLHGIVATELPLNRVIVVPTPRAFAPS